MDSLAKVYERILLFIVCLVGPALFFLLYQPAQKRVLAYELSRDFLESASSAGALDAGSYAVFLDGLAKIDGFDVSVSGTTFHGEPVYAYYGKGEIESHFAARNVWDRHYYKTEPPEVTDADPASLRMQQETNATVLARLMDEGLPLGNGIAGAYSCEAAVPAQEVYAGEYLVTVVRVDTGDSVYFAVGDEMQAAAGGDYRIRIGGADTGAVVHAAVWPRTVRCPVCGNNYACTKEVVARYKESGTWEFCPHCDALVRDIVADVPQLSVPVGTAEAEIADVTFTVVYYNGTEETLPLSAFFNNYSASYAGRQDISVSYKGCSNEGIVSITTFCPDCLSCGGRIAGRNAFDCRLYPYCADCMEAVPVFLGECAVVPETFSPEELEEALLNGDGFVFGRGDYLEVTVSHGRKYGGKNSVLSPDRDIYFRAGKRIRRAVPK